MSSRILVTSAAGKVGRAVVRQLQEMGECVRAAVRDPEKAADLGGPATEIVPFDSGDGEARLRSEALVPVSRRYKKELRERLSPATPG